MNDLNRIRQLAGLTEDNHNDTEKWVNFIHLMRQLIMQKTGGNPDANQRDEYGRTNPDIAHFHTIIRFARERNKQKIKQRLWKMDTAPRDEVWDRLDQARLTNYDGQLQEDDQVNEEQGDMKTVISNIISACDVIKERLGDDWHKAKNYEKLKKIEQDLWFIDDQIMIELEQNLPDEDYNSP